MKIRALGALFGAIFISGCVPPSGVRSVGGPLKIVPVTYNDTQISQAELIGGPGNDYGEYLPCAADGSCDLIGTSKESFGPGAGFLVSHLDASGNVSWARDYDVAGNDFVTDAVSTRDGGVVLAVNSYSQFGDMASYPGRGLLLKLSPAGDPLWALLLAAPYEGYTVIRVTGVAQAPDGSLVMTGACEDSGKDDQQINDLFVMKFSADGKGIWSHCYKFDHDTYGGHVQLEGDGRIRVDADYYDSPSETDKTHPLVVTLTAEGACQQVEELLADDGHFHIMGIREQSDGEIVLPGEVTNSGKGRSDSAAIVWLNQDGSVRAARDYSVEGGFAVRGADLLPDGIALLGHTGAYQPKSLDDAFDAIAFLVDSRGDVRAETKAVSRRPGPHGFSFGEFQGIEQFAPGRYRLLGDTAAFSDNESFDVLTAQWIPASTAPSLITSPPLTVKSVSIKLPNAYDGKFVIDQMPVARIDITDLKTAAAQSH